MAVVAGTAVVLVNAAEREEGHASYRRGAHKMCMRFLTGGIGHPDPNKTAL